MTFFRSILLLNWKNLRYRRQEYTSSIFEIGFPIALLYFFTQTNQYFGVMRKKINIPNEIYQPKSVMEYFDNFEAMNVTYTPSNIFTDELMQRVSGKIKNLTREMIKSYEDEKSMVIDHYNDTYGIGIVFLKFKIDEIGGHNFTYKIRDKLSNAYQTKELLPQFLDGVISPYSEFYEKGNFVILQMALDEAFIELTTNLSNLPKLNIEKMPSPKKEIDYVFRSKLTETLPQIISIGYLFVLVAVISSIISEKESGIKELMKIMGMKNWMIWTGWLLNVMMSCIIINTIVTILLKFNFTKYENAIASMEYSDASLIWIFLTLYCVASTYMCFAISTIFTNAQIATTMGSFALFGSYFAFSTFLDDILKSTLLTNISMLFPTGVLCIIMETIGNLETEGVGARWSTLMARQYKRDVYIAYGLLWLIAECVIYDFLRWYIESIHPGKYGVAKPYYFIIQWITGTKEISTPNLEKEYHDEKYFEKPASKLEVGLRTEEVRKNYGNFTALKGITLDVYKGEITALLGQNGAGKTTLMSIITGMIKPTSGKVLFDNVNILENMSYFRESLGLCPQENMQFSFLTVMDHMLFFAMLKGYTMAHATEEAEKLLTTLELHDKRSSLSETLSGGMKRKLSLAISLIGNPKVLLLDEPTSGLDVQSRRSVWDLLLAMRGNRIVLLSTHYMEEADALSDRIAIMYEGTVVCHGTPMFLKRAFGTGYQLSIEQSCTDQNEELKKVVEQFVPTSEVKSETQSIIEINIPMDEAIHFPALFSSLESSKEKLCIATMTIACTTLEGVFFKVGKLMKGDNDDDDDDDSEINFDDEIDLATRRKAKGLILHWKQFYALSCKKILCSLREWMLLLFYSVLLISLGYLSIVTLYYTVILVGYQINQNPPLELSLSTYSAEQPVQAAINSLPEAPQLFKQAYVNQVKQMEGNIMEFSSSNFTADLLMTANKDVKKYWRELIAGIEADEKSNTIFYNPIPYHSLPVSINTYTNALLNFLSSNDNNSSIVTINYPIGNANQPSDCEMMKGVGLFVGFIWIMVYVPLISLTSYYIRLPSSERTSGFYHIQIMSNLSSWYYWVVSLMWDFVHFIIVIVFVLLVIKIGDKHDVFTNNDGIGTLFVIFALYGLSAIPYAYVFSHFNDSRESSIEFFNQFNSFIVLGLTIAVKILTIIESMKLETTIFYSILEILSKILNILPSSAFLSSIFQFSTVSWSNNYCQFCQKSVNCTVTQSPYFVMSDIKTGKNGILEEVLFMIGSSVLYILILVILDWHLFERFQGFILNTFHKKDNDDDDDEEESEQEDVQMERERVEKLQKNPTPEIILVVNNLVKSFLVKFKKKFQAVKGVSFAVKPGECFGLLGVNGAGKSTTFKMLTADLLPSSGDASIKGISISKDKRRYLSMVGYCPQFNSIIDLLTAQEMLELMCHLRGIRRRDIDLHVNKWISVLGLEKYKNRRSGNYSGGNKRKLCTAISLIGDPEVVFLDEPTSGVDPISRRKLYAVMEYSKKAGQAVVLTSHSMEECESLCDRLTIMVAGEMKCIGSIPYLKQRYAQGFTIMIRLKDEDDPEMLQEAKTEIPEQIMNRFEGSCTLKDEHMVRKYQRKESHIIDIDHVFNEGQN